MEHYDRLKSKLLTVIPNAVINKNSVPPHFRRLAGKSSTGENKYFDEKREEFVHYPRFGSFEVYVDGVLIFSKLKSNLWPKHDKLVKIIEQFYD